MEENFILAPDLVRIGTDESEKIIHKLNIWD